MTKILASAFLLSWFLPQARAAEAPEVLPQYAQQAEADAARDRLVTSLFFRGELADKIIGSGMAGRFVSLEGIETNAGAKTALLAWIQKNPAEAAQVYLNMKGAGGRLHDRIETREMSWEFNPNFLDMIKALNAAAGNASISKETLELAARRLYEGRQAEAEGPVVRVGGSNGAGGGFFSINYADYRLNKGGLEREVLQTGAWLAAARGGRPRLEIEGAYSAALSMYSELVVAASALKGRGAVTEREASGLEALRVRLRSALAALVLRSRSAALSEAAAALDKNGAEPGAGELLLAASRLTGLLEARAALVEAGGVPLGDLGKLVNSAEKEFAAYYLRYSAYYGLLSLKNRAARPGFSCLYDYAVYRYLSAFFPGTAYPAARAELAAAAGPLDTALRRLGAGDLAGAFSGLKADRVEAAVGEVRAASAFNRGAQFFLWGLLFRPVEYKISFSGGRAAFRPVFTFFEVAVKNK